MMVNDYVPIAMWVSERAGCSVPHVGAALGVLQSDRLTAGVLYESYTGASITATIAIDAGTHITKGFMRAIFDYPFNQLAVKKLFAMVSAKNAASIDFVTRCGFSEETRIRDYYDSGDAIVFACTRESCRWLDLPPTKH